MFYPTQYWINPFIIKTISLGGVNLSDVILKKNIRKY